MNEVLISNEKERPSPQDAQRWIQNKKKHQPGLVSEVQLFGQCGDGCLAVGGSALVYKFSWCGIYSSHQHSNARLVEMISNFQIPLKLYRGIKKLAMYKRREVV